MQIQIAENIRKHRIKQGLTQGDIAILLSVSPQAVSRWENGQAFPDITLLPLLAKYLNVSIDELMGAEAQKNKHLEKELYEREQAIIEDESQKRQNEQRIFAIYEELATTKIFYLISYFQYLMRKKKNGDFVSEDLEDRIEIARQMIRDRLRASNMYDGMQLLSVVASYEEEDKLTLWADEYQTPEYLRANFWDRLLLSRYTREKDIHKLSEQNQKLLYDHIQNTVYYLTDSVSNDIKEQSTEFGNLERYKTALDMLSLYSTQVDDVFIFTRIIAEVRYAEALLINGYVEECLETFALVTEHLLLLHKLPEGSVLCGSVPVLNSVQLVVNANDKIENCVFHIGGYDKNPLFDKIRTDKRFIECMKVLESFLPKWKSRVWVNENGSEPVDAQWEMLVNRAKKEADKLSDGNVVVMLTTKGTVISIAFSSVSSSIQAENTLKFLIDKKKDGESKIARMICMWHGGGIDLPSYAFREALVDIDSQNLSAQILLNGLGGYVVKTVKATMPKGYKA